MKLQGKKIFNQIKLIIKEYSQQNNEYYIYIFIYIFIYN